MAEVLLVDDDGSVLLTLAIALRRQGHGVTVAGDAYQALTHLKKLRFDFMISDVRMPGVSGLELAAHARAMPTPPRIILTSAYPFVEDRESVSEAFMQKPLDVHLLSQYLNSPAPGTSGAANNSASTPAPTESSSAPTTTDASSQSHPAQAEETQAQAARVPHTRVENTRPDAGRGSRAAFARHTLRAST